MRRYIFEYDIMLNIAEIEVRKETDKSFVGIVVRNLIGQIYLSKHRNNKSKYQVFETLDERAGS